ncbi:hypothetical protein CDAR_7701 [Caerostris darwini]|uniref:Uncharacterized protein n=1 Tax=Caerostris darwini TaxID=1538125 RepID=A0AAV4RBZ4_9ARAC|nr:hypothetical protein CDAR_7701 [Caerostris darwini]
MKKKKNLISRSGRKKKKRIGRWMCWPSALRPAQDRAIKKIDKSYVLMIIQGLSGDPLQYLCWILWSYCSLNEIIDFLIHVLCV